MTKQSIDQMQLPDVDAAMATLNDLYAERFFAKMAEYGHVPRSKEAAEAMLQDATLLDQIPEEKQAADVDPYVVAHEKLAEYVRNAAPAMANQEQVKLAAAVATNPDVYRAVLAIKAAEAAAV